MKLLSQRITDFLTATDDRAFEFFLEVPPDLVNRERAARKIARALSRGVDADPSTQTFEDERAIFNALTHPDVEMEFSSDFSNAVRRWIENASRELASTENETINARVLESFDALTKRLVDERATTTDVQRAHRLDAVARQLAAIRDAILNSSAPRLETRADGTDARVVEIPSDARDAFERGMTACDEVDAIVAKLRANDGPMTNERRAALDFIDSAIRSAIRKS